jgi:hypothetical protein
MFEHREGHPAPSGAGTASRLSRGHVSLALSITETATPHRSPPPPRPVVFTAHALTARIVKLARTAATDLNAKHHTPQMGRWGALRAVCSTLRRSLSPADRNHASQPARPGCICTAHTLTARIVKPACTAAADLNVKHRTPQLGGWYAQRAVGSTLRCGLSPADRNHASQPAQPTCTAAHSTR